MRLEVGVRRSMRSGFLIFVCATGRRAPYLQRRSDSITFVTEDTSEFERVSE